jgi:hypothetical protein
MPNGEYRFSKQWAIQADHDEVRVGQTIVVYTQAGPKKVRVTDIVVRSTKAGKAYDLLFTVDVD